MSKNKMIIAGGITVTLIIAVIIVAAVNHGTKKQEDKVTTVTSITTVTGESSLTTSTGSNDQKTQKSDSGETATNKTYGNNQGDNYAVDIFTDKAVENKTKKPVGTKKNVETKKNTETKKQEKNPTGEKPTKDGQSDKNDPNSDDGWTDFY